jgi:hypothetical protein
MKNRILFWIGPLALAAGLCTILRADDMSSAAGTQSLQDQATQAWLLDHFVAVTKDPDGAGVWAVEQSVDILKDQPAQSTIDYFQKMLYQTKSRAVQRAIRAKLVDLYRSTNRNDKAGEQLEALMTDSGE